MLKVARVLVFVAAALPAVAAADPPSGAVLTSAAAPVALAAPAPAPGAAAPGNTAATPRTDAADGPRQGPFLVASIGAGRALFAADLQLGWTFTPELSAFVSLGGFAAVEDEGGGVTTKGLGARLWHVPFYVEVRAEAATFSTGCEDADPCGSSTEWLWAVGVGAELVHTRHFGLELRAEELLANQDTAFMGSLGLGFHY